MSEFKDILKDALYTHVGAVTTAGEKIIDGIDEYREKGKEVVEKSKDLNEELKHRTKDYFDEKKSEKKDVLSLLDDMTDEDKKKLKEALVNEETKKKAK